METPQIVPMYSCILPIWAAGNAKYRNNYGIIKSLKYKKCISDVGNIARWVLHNTTKVMQNMGEHDTIDTQ